jgi:DNA-binding NarL/FixJ family response regulator
VEQDHLPDDDPDRVRVLVIEPEGPSRAGLISLLSQQPWVDSCLATAERDEAASLARRHGPAVVLVEVSAFLSAFVEAIRSAHDGARIVLHSQCPVAGTVLMRQMRAAAFIGPEATSKTIVDVVHNVATDGAASSTAPKRDDNQLNAREREILTMLSTGASNREIADALHLGTDSISKYASRIYRKLGVKNRTEAAQRFAAMSQAH